MSNSAHLIPRNRLTQIPGNLRLAHEYCFFLHDEFVRMLTDYEGAEAHLVSIKFKNESEANTFHKLTQKNDAVTSMRLAGYETEARRVVLNQITMAMVSDSAHHIYEALRCLEKRKVVVAFNLLRKPLTDSLLYLSWMLGNEDEFYQAFSAGNPNRISSSVLKSNRKEIIAGALAKTDVDRALDPVLLDSLLFDRKNPQGLQELFQHAVHLVTVQHIELKTEPENFNFIFKDPTEDDLYEAVYATLPYVLLYLSNVVLGLFRRIAQPDDSGASAFKVRSVLGLYLLQGGESEAHAIETLEVLRNVKCPSCNSRLHITLHNAARLVLTESYRCTTCRRVQLFPLSWMF